jgi:hypothetical protein
MNLPTKTIVAKLPTTTKRIVAKLIKMKNT